MEWLEARARNCSSGEEALGGSCGLWREARGGSCGLWREARRGNFICVRGGKVGRGPSSLLGPFYMPGCVVPLLVCVGDASFELSLIMESGIGLARSFI